MELFRKLVQIATGLTLMTSVTFAKVKETRQLISDWVET